MRWFRGAAGEDGLARLATVLDPGFTLISPDGSVRDRATVLRGIVAAHGARPDLTIVVDGFSEIAASPTFTVGRYREHHDTPQGRTTRVSTVVFTADDAAPNGCRWLAVHETWHGHG